MGCASLAPAPMEALHKALAVTGLAAATIPFIVLSSRTWLSLTAAAAAVTGAIYQQQVLHVREDAWTHIAVGTGALRLSWIAVSGNGGPLRVHWVYGALGAAINFVIFLGLTIIHGYARVYNQMHAVIDLGQVVLFISFGMESAVSSASRHGFCDTRRAHRWLASAARIRPLHDAAALVAIALATIKHQHDLQPIGVFFHEKAGFFVAAAAALIFTSSCVHGHLPWQAPLCKMMRALYALSLAMIGLLLIHMAVFVYVEQSCSGFHHIIYGDEARDEVVATEVCSRR